MSLYMECLSLVKGAIQYIAVIQPACTVRKGNIVPFFSRFYWPCQKYNESNIPQYGPYKLVQLGFYYFGSLINPI